MEPESRLARFARSISRFFFRYLFRYDVFISYAHHDGKDYAPKLREQLQEKGFSCFLDKHDSQVGNSLDETLKKELKKSATLVVVGSQGAVQSHYVELEIMEFAKTKRAIIPINIGDALKEPPWSIIKERNPFMITESLESLLKGEPSDIVADSIMKRFVYTRRKRRVRIQNTAITIVLVVTALLSAIFAQAAQRERKIAEDATISARKQEEIAIAKAEEAKQQTELAEQNRDEAIRQQAQAIANAKKAQKAQIAANEGRAQAERATALANQQLQLIKAQGLATQSQLAFDKTQGGLKQSLLLASESLHKAWTPEAHIEWSKAIELLPARPPKVRVAHEHGTIQSIAFSPDGERVATGGAEGIVKMLTSDGKPNGELKMEKAADVTAIAFSDDRRWVATGCQGEIEVWDMEKRSLVKAISVRGNPRSIAFSPDARYMIAVYPSEDTILFEASGDWNPVAAIRTEASRVYSAAFSPDGRWLAVGGSATLELWEVDALAQQALTDKQRSSDRLKARWSQSRTPAGGVLHLAFKKTGRLVAICEDSPFVYSLKEFYEIKQENGNLRFVPFRNIPLPQFAGYRALAFTDDCNFLALADTRKGVHILRTKDGGEVARFPLDEDINATAFSPGGYLLATGGKYAKIWDAAEEKTMTLVARQDNIESLAISPDAKWLIAVGDNNQASIFDMKSEWKEQTPISVPGVEALHQAAFSPDGRLLALASDRVVALFNVADWSLIHSCQPDNNFSSLGFSPDSHLLLIAGDNASQVIEIGHPWRASQLMGHEGQLNKIAFSPDSHKLMTYKRDEDGRGKAVTRIWDPITGRELLRKVHTNDKNGQNQSQGQTDITKDEDIDYHSRLTAGKNISVLESASTWKAIPTEESKVLKSQDGRFQVNIAKPWREEYESSEGVTLRELKNNRALMRIGQSVKAGDFSPDSRWLVTASGGKSIKIWPLDTQYMIDLACKRLRFAMTQEERTLLPQGSQRLNACREAP